MLIGKLAWRNIWRNRRRTLLTMLAILFSSGLLVFAVALQLSSYETSINAFIGIYQGHFQVQAKGYLEEPEEHLVISDPTQLRHDLLSIPGIKGVALRANGFALVSSASRSYGVQVVGVIPEQEKQVSNIPTLVRQGQYLEEADSASMVLGAFLAQNLQVKPGDEITLLGQGRDGSVAAAVLSVKGIFESGNAELDRSLVQMPLATFQDTFSMGDAAHALVIAGTGMDEIQSARISIQQAVKKFAGTEQQLELHDWEALSPGLMKAIELDMLFGWLFFFSLVLVVTFSVLNTFLMSSLERTREFGMMLALGLKPKQIAGLLITECLFLTLLALALGIACGSSVVAYYHVHGFYIPGSEEIIKVWSLPAVFRPKISLLALTLGPSILLVTTSLSILYPVFKILKLEAVSAMRAV